MSVSGTDRKFDVRNWATAKTSPPTSATPQVSRRPRTPSTSITSTNGTKTARTGVCRPTTAPSMSSGSPVTWARVVIGTAIAPKATGAVLATSATTAALSGGKLTAMSITVQMATGAPKPASASSSAPKANAMMIACTRWSSETELKERRRTSKCPVRTVIR